MCSLTLYQSDNFTQKHQVQDQSTQLRAGNKKSPLFTDAKELAYDRDKDRDSGTQHLLRLLLIRLS